MASFSCSACGSTWSDDHNYSGCPNCGGLGLKDAKCTCVCWKVGFVRTGLVHKKDPKCPIHGRSKAKKK